MLVKLDHPKMFSDIVSIISELVLEVRIKVNKEGMSILAVDPANVAMISFKLPASAFSQLEVEEENLGVSLDSLKSVLRRASPGSSLVMKTEENILKIQIQDKTKREFELTLIEIEQEEKPLPSLEFTSKIEMRSVDFIEAIEDCAIVSDSCSFESNPNLFVISGRGSLNAARVEFSSDEIKIQAKEDKSKYSIEYLQKMIKGAKIVEKTEISFSKDYPLRLDFKTPLMELSFILAPRVDTED